MDDRELASLMATSLKMTVMLERFMFDKRELLCSVIMSYIKSEIREEDRERQYEELGKICSLVHMGITKSFDPNFKKGNIGGLDFGVVGI